MFENSFKKPAWRKLFFKKYRQAIGAIGVVIAIVAIAIPTFVWLVVKFLQFLEYASNKFGTTLVVIVMSLTFVLIFTFFICWDLTRRECWED